jgi:glycosyltransferase involved in cell wall biosynthesis
VPESRIVVTLLAADKNLAVAEPLDRFKIGGEFLFNVGNVYPYKNLGLVVEALRVLAPKYPRLKLVSTSKPDYFRDQLEAYARQLGVADRVVFTGFVTDGELVNLYRKAKLYVYPSLAEGFGLQMLESMIQGLPVVAARSSCLPEIGGAAAAYFDPKDPEKLADLIDHLLRDERRCDTMQEAGYERAKQFSWAQTVQQTLAVYHQISIT